MRTLRPFVLLILTCSGVVGCASSTEHRFQAHIDYLASDELEGRGVGSRGIELAANYIAKEFVRIGLEPAGDNGTYFQTFEMTLHRELTDESRLSITGDSTERKLGVDFIPFNFSSDAEFSGPLVFCGYGIVDPEREYDDFAKVDISGAVALIFEGEPPSWADEEGNPTRHSLLRDKVYNAKDRGAVAVLLVNSLPLPEEEDVLTEFVAQGADEYGVPAFDVTRALAGWAVEAGGLGTLDELQEKLDAGTPSSSIVAHKAAEGRTGFVKRTAPTHNVIGVHRGAGPLAGEFVVIGAHYDHLGIRKPMMRKFKDGKIVRDAVGPQIHNGADDNASGTSGLIEIARMFSSSPPVDRSVVFVAFTAEETGLHGSKYYVESAGVGVAPLDQTVAMLNMDMIGRLEPGSDKVQVFGTKCGKSFSGILDSVSEAVGLTVFPGVDAGGRSDQAPFVAKEIPSMHFFTGIHSDYHKPSDDSYKINAAGGVQVADFVYRVAHEIATREARPEFQVVKAKKKEPTGGTPSYRVVMGLAPGYADDGKPGMNVDAVNPDGPAEIAGMKAGDRIVKINDKTVGNIYDYMAATRNNNAGDTVVVVVLRDGEEHTLHVTLSAAR